MNQHPKAQSDICVVGGIGHVGLPLSVVFATRNLHVLIYEVDHRAMDPVQKRRMPFMERGSEALLKGALSKGLITFTNQAKDIAGARAVVITSGTPVDEFLTPSLRMIRKCFDDLFPFLSEEQLVVISSSVYPGVVESMSKYALSRDKCLKLPFCPERHRRSHAIEEL